MAKQTTEIKTIHLKSTKKGMISIAHIEEPYGEFSSPVVSVGISIDGETNDWKVHIPYDNLEEVIEALREAHALSDKLLHKQQHTMDLNAETGGGA